MAYTNTKQHSGVAPSNRGALRPEAEGPGYHAPTLNSAVERELNLQIDPPTTSNTVTPETAQPGPNALRRVLNRVREHPGYTNTPSQQALARIHQAARNPRH